ncbi:hypothetical protein MLD38_015569 [Melastoma candidum]|uniref:Uncharacterized protein n=1 Tax=Melastoma candidum TaxID=119954 RepID=A0ACB9RIF6_9MYRT|nr:hypothetical protein MLD38_015569 [Melastoma candidum]
MPSVVLGSEGVTSSAPTDGEHHFDALVLAVLDIGANFRALMTSAMAREVELRGPAFPERRKEGNVDIFVVSGGTGLGQGALVPVLAPVDGDSPAIRSGEQNGEQGKDECP